MEKKTKKRENILFSRGKDRGQIWDRGRVARYTMIRNNNQQNSPFLAAPSSRPLSPISF